MISEGLAPALLEGNVLDILPTLPEESVHCVVTSPPYWGLRDYGLPPVLWGGDSTCHHEWTELPPRRERSPDDVRNPASLQAGHPGANIELRPTEGCVRCGGWVGQLGLEPTPELYVEHVATVFDQVRRVLRSDGTLWLNLGDTFHTDSPVRHSSSEAFLRIWDPAQTRSRGGNRRSASRNGQLKAKDLAGIPWRVAFELQRRGWWLRSDCIWAKRNPMPESVADRPTALPRIRLPPHEVEAVPLRRRGGPGAGLRGSPSQGRAGRPEAGGSRLGCAIQQELRPCRRRGPPARAGTEPAVRLVDCDPRILRGALRDIPGGAPRYLHPGGNFRARLLRGVRPAVGSGGTNGRRVDRPRLATGQVDRARSGAGDRPTGPQ